MAVQASSTAAAAAKEAVEQELEAARGLIKAQALEVQRSRDAAIAAELEVLTFFPSVLISKAILPVRPLIIGCKINNSKWLRQN